jgi:fibronectin type 3 domain-containing protein
LPGSGGTRAIPSVPAGVTATAQSANSISVSWNPVSGAASYKVYYEIGMSSAKNPAGTATDTSYTHTGLDDGTTYFKVAA